VIAGDFNGHVGERSEGFEGVHGGKGYGSRNEDGERLLEFADSTNMKIINTTMDKPPRKRITFSSGGNKTQVDYILVQEAERKRVRNVNTIAMEDCVRQHRLLYIDWNLCQLKPHLQPRIKRIRVRRLKEETVRKRYIEQFEYKISTSTDRTKNVNTLWKRFKGAVLAAATEACEIS